MLSCLVLSTLIREERSLGQLCHGLGKVETSAIGAVALLARSGALQDHEIRYFNERMLPDERAHGDMFARWAQTFGHDSEIFPLVQLYLRDLGFLPHLPRKIAVPFALAILRIGEVQSLIGLPRLMRDLGPYPDFRSDLCDLLEDEKQHHGSTLRILSRWDKEQPLLAKVHRRYFNALKAPYSALQENL